MNEFFNGPRGAQFDEKRYGGIAIYEMSHG